MINPKCQIEVAANCLNTLFKTKLIHVPKSKHWDVETKPTCSIDTMQLRVQGKGKTIVLNNRKIKRQLIV